jgi:aspartate/methionine/tyrosine aminotransferase
VLRALRYNPPALTAARLDLLGFSDIVRIRNRVLDMKSRGERVLQLEGGEPFMPTPPFVKEAMKRAIDENQTRYAPSSGIAPLLEAIRVKLAERNRITAATDEIIVTAGGAHALFCAFQATVNPGDEVMFFSPYWTPIKDQVSYCGGVPVLVPWDEIRGRVAEALESHVTARTRVLYVNSPSNPTGNVLTRAELEEVARFAIAHDLVVIADEAYEDLVYDGEHVSLASLPEMKARTITCFTLSKSFAMTGWRIGYLVAEAAFMGGIRKLVLNSVNGVSTPTQFAAAAAIGDRSSYFDWARDEYRKRRDLLVGALNEAGFRCPSPPGAFYLFPQYPERLGNDSWAAMEALLKQTSIASVPGAVFGPHGEGHLRMSFSTSVEILEECAAALKNR